MRSHKSYRPASSSPGASGCHHAWSVLAVCSFTMGVSFTTRLQRPRWFSTHTQSPSFTPNLSAVFGFTYTSGSGCSARMRGIWRCSEWNMPHKRAPVVSTSGYSSHSSGVESGLGTGSS